VSGDVAERRFEERRWVLLAYRMPREPSTPRIAVWRKLRRLGVAQLIDGLVALPHDERAREALEWLAEEVIEAGGEANVWLAEALTSNQHRLWRERLREAITAEYRAVIEQAESVRGEDDRTVRRTVGKLRRQLAEIRGRDYFPPPERRLASEAVKSLATVPQEEAVR
jgi:hypothetical protein